MARAARRRASSDDSLALLPRTRCPSTDDLATDSVRIAGAERLGHPLQPRSRRGRVVNTRRFLGGNCKLRLTDRPTSRASRRIAPRTAMRVPALSGVERGVSSVEATRNDPGAAPRRAGTARDGGGSIVAAGPDAGLLRAAIRRRRAGPSSASEGLRFVFEHASHGRRPTPRSPPPRPARTASARGDARVVRVRRRRLAIGPRSSAPRRGARPMPRATPAARSSPSRHRWRGQARTGSGTPPLSLRRRRAAPAPRREVAPSPRRRCALPPAQSPRSSS